jgi:hypothetical protein
MLPGARRACALLLWGALAAALSGPASAQPAAAPGASPAAPAASVLQARPGDTFSGLVARLTGSADRWRAMFRPGKSRLANPNLILVGMRFEVAKDEAGDYLRLIDGDAGPTVAAGGRAAPAARAALPAAATSPMPLPAAPMAAGPLVIGVLPNTPPRR